MYAKQDFKIQTVVQYEVIGRGKMITQPCQIGEWWVMPAQLYKGNIPEDIKKNVRDFLSQRSDVVGILIAEDMRELEAKQQKKAEVVPQVLPQILPWVVPEVMPEVRPQVIPETRPQIRPQALPEVRHETRPQARQEVKREEIKRDETNRRSTGTNWGWVGSVLAGIGMVMLFVVGAALRFDPMLIAVLPPDEEDIAEGRPGKWLCLGVWWD